MGSFEAGRVLELSTATLERHHSDSLGSDSQSSTKRDSQTQLTPGLRINSQRPIETAMLILVRDMGFAPTPSRIALLESATNVENAVDLLTDLNWMGRQGFTKKAVTEQFQPNRRSSSSLSSRTKRQKLEEKKRDENLMYCAVCMEWLQRNLIHVNDECVCVFCKNCLIEHYRVRITDGDVLDLKCIGPECDRIIQKEEILTFVEGEMLVEKFHRFYEQRLLQRNPNCRWCPKPGCGMHIIGSEKQPKLECPTCCTIICYHCNGLWHEGSKCEDVVDSEYAKWAEERRETVKRCPQCRATIEKSGGCNSMVCSSCKHEFCWLCLRKVTSPAHFTAGNFLGCPGGMFADEPRTTGRRLVSFLCLLFCLPWVCCEACICVTCCHE